MSPVPFGIQTLPHSFIVANTMDKSDTSTLFIQFLYSINENAEKEISNVSLANNHLLKLAHLKPT